MSNILITGSKGQLGSEIRELAEKKDYLASDMQCYFTDRDTLDITDQNALEDFCNVNHIDIIINCAAYTAVDKAEKDTGNADKINHKAVKYLSEIAKERQIKLVHISTDYVFDGMNYKPYTENDPTAPNGVYGSSKLAGEKAMIETGPKNSIIIRTSWVYSSFGANFVKTMLRLGKEKDTLGVIFDQVGTPTYAKDLAEAVLTILPKITNNRVEIYHYSNEGVCSWYDFAQEIFELSGTSCHINAIETKDYPTPAKRPHYSLLNKAKIKKTFMIEIPYWKTSLKTCLKTMGELN